MSNNLIVDLQNQNSWVFFVTVDFDTYHSGNYIFWETIDFLKLYEGFAVTIGQSTHDPLHPTIKTVGTPAGAAAELQDFLYPDIICTLFRIQIFWEGRRFLRLKSSSFFSLFFFGGGV